MNRQLGMSSFVCFFFEPVTSSGYHLNYPTRHSLPGKMEIKKMNAQKRRRRSNSQIHTCDTRWYDETGPEKWLREELVRSGQVNRRRGRGWVAARA